MFHMFKMLMMNFIWSIACKRKSKKATKRSRETEMESESQWILAFWFWSLAQKWSSEREKKAFVLKTHRADEMMCSRTAIMSTDISLFFFSSIWFWCEPHWMWSNRICECVCVWCLHNAYCCSFFGSVKVKEQRAVKFGHLKFIIIHIA